MSVVAIDPAAAGELYEGAEMIVVSRSRLQKMELRADLNARHIQLLQEQVTQAKDALAREQARSERQASAFVEVARTCDNRVRELEAQSAEKRAELMARIADLETSNVAVVAQNNAAAACMKETFIQLEASHAAAVAAKDAALATLQAAHAVTVAAKDAVIAEQRNRIGGLRTSHAATVADKDAIIVGLRQNHARSQASYAAIITAKNAALADAKKTSAELEASHADTIAAKDALIARDKQRPVELQHSTIPATVTSVAVLEANTARHTRGQFGAVSTSPVTFDRTWCAAACGDKWKVAIDTRAHVTQIGEGLLTLRTADPLPRHVPSIGASPQRLPAYRIIIEAYSAAGKYCHVGFVPSRTPAGALVTPVVGNNIHHYGGWWFEVKAAEPCALRGPSMHGWTPMTPRAAAGAHAAAPDSSAHATTDEAPPVDAGSAIELAVDYAAGRCRVAFYTPCGSGGWVRGGAVRQDGAALYRD
jgi:hypothetical protein